MKQAKQQGVYWSGSDYRVSHPIWLYEIRFEHSRDVIAFLEQFDRFADFWA